MGEAVPRRILQANIPAPWMGVARATVREALRFLELQGALRIKAGPGGGPIVSVPGAGHLASVLSLQLQFAAASYRSVLEARRSIYPVLAAEAAANASHQDIETLHQSIARMRTVIEDSDLLIDELIQLAQPANGYGKRRLIRCFRIRHKLENYHATE